MDAIRSGPRSTGEAGGAAPWGIILAGGDGARLRTLTRRIAGDDRPKQFCAVLGNETLLAQTRRRAARTIAPSRTLVVVTRPHEPFYGPALADMPSRAVVVQPENRGTAPALLYALLRVSATAPSAPVAIFPSDHFVSDDDRFMGHVDAALEAARRRPDLLILLGVAPDRPETGYGWIEPDVPLVWGHTPWPTVVSGVRRFWEKAELSLARRLRKAGCLWNSFVMVAPVPTFLSMILDTVPELYHAFGDLPTVRETAGEADTARALYRSLPTVDFSRQILGARPSRLAVLPVRGLAWSDLGDPRRVEETRTRVAVGCPSASRSFLVDDGLRHPAAVSQ